MAIVSMNEAANGNVREYTQVLGVTALASPLVIEVAGNEFI